MIERREESEREEEREEAWMGIKQVEGHAIPRRTRRSSGRNARAVVDEEEAMAMLSVQCFLRKQRRSFLSFLLLQLCCFKMMMI